MNTKRIILLGLAGLVTNLTNCGKDYIPQNGEPASDDTSQQVTNSADAYSPLEKKCWRQVEGNDDYDEQIDSVRQTPEGGYLLAESDWRVPDQTSELSTSHAWVKKVDSNGELEWDTFFGYYINGKGTDYFAHEVRPTMDGGAVVCGERFFYTSDGSTMSGWTAKLNKEGGVEWNNKIGGSGDCDFYDLYSIEQTKEGGYIAAGMSDTSCFDVNTPESGMWIVKLFASGEISWDVVLPDQYGRADSIKPTNDGGYIVAGINAGNAQFVGHVAKLDSTGGSIWEKNYCTTDKSCWINSIQQTNDGGYVAAGVSSLLNQEKDNINDKVWILKLDKSGDVEWEKKYGASIEGESNRAEEIQQTTDLGYIVAAGDWILKLNPEGEVQWDNSLTEYLNSIQQTFDGGYITGGYISNSSSDDAVFMKLDQNGKTCD
jgi:hypothetical protein